jgi:hypothetical protein
MVSAEPQKLNELDDLPENQYNYGCFDQVLVYGITLVSSVLALFLFADLIVGAYSVMGRELSVDELATTGGYFLLVVFLSLTVSSVYPSFRISRSGMTVQVFLFWWAFVPWDDVQEIRDTLLGINKLVIVRKLTPIHRLYGWTLGLTPRPAFVIRKRIEGYDKAIKIIQRNTVGT